MKSAQVGHISRCLGVRCGSQSLVEQGVINHRANYSRSPQLKTIINQRTAPICIALAAHWTVHCTPCIKQRCTAHIENIAQCIKLHHTVHCTLCSLLQCNWKEWSICRRSTLLESAIINLSRRRTLRRLLQVSLHCALDLNHSAMLSSRAVQGGNDQSLDKSRRWPRCRQSSQSLMYF